MIELMVSLTGLKLDIVPICVLLLEDRGCGVIRRGVRAIQATKLVSLLARRSFVVPQRF
jgi:hypothetical protein